MSFPIPFIKKSPYKLPILSGLLLVLCQPPVSLSPLAFVALVPLLLDIAVKKPNRSFLCGLITGVVSFAGLVYWVVVSMNTYGGLSPALSVLVLGLMVIYLALYVGVFAWSVSQLRTRGIEPYLAAPFLWVILEYGRGFLLTGFPWSFLAHSQHNFLPFIQIASITGSYFLSFLIVAVNGIIATAIRKKAIPWPFFIVTALLFVISLGFGINRLRVTENQNLTAAIVQGNLPQDVKWDEAFKAYTIDIYRDLSIKYGPGASLVVWPETSMPFVFDHDPAGSALADIPVRMSSPLLFGVITKDSSNRFYNSAVLLGRNGVKAGTYSKVHLVPFGEFTPLRKYFPFLANISVQIGDFFEGESHKPVKIDAGSVGTLICYEGVFPTITNASVREGANVLVNITNDAWFGRTSAAYQHLGFYVFRAVETDRWVLRAANTGFSAIIDPQGHIRQKTGLFEKTVLTGRYAMKESQTFYVRHGDYFLLIMALGLALLIAKGFLRRKRVRKT